MKLEITEKKKNELIGRVEVFGTLVYQGITPSNADITNEIAKQLKVDATIVVVKQIKGVFSKQEAKVTAFAYNDVKAKDKYEMSTKHLRKIAEEKSKKEAEAKQAQAEEKAAADAKKKEEEAAASEAKAEPAVVEETKNDIAPTNTESKENETPKEEADEKTTETPVEAPASETKTEPAVDETEKKESTDTPTTE